MAFMNGVEQAHGVDFSDGIPAGYSIVGALLDAVVDGVQPEFESPSWKGTPSLPSRPPIRSMGEALPCSPSYRRYIRRSWGRDVLRPGRRTIMCVRRAQWQPPST